MHVGNSCKVSCLRCTCTCSCVRTEQYQSRRPTIKNVISVIEFFSIVYTWKLHIPKTIPVSLHVIDSTIQQFSIEWRDWYSLRCILSLLFNINFEKNYSLNSLLDSSDIYTSPNIFKIPARVCTVDIWYVRVKGPDT